MPPEYVLAIAGERIKVPLPCFMRDPLPLMVPVNVSVVEALGLITPAPVIEMFLGEEKLAAVCKVPEPMPIVFDAAPRFASVEMRMVPDWIDVVAV